jgi:hypothetical protein
MEAVKAKFFAAIVIITLVFSGEVYPIGDIGVGINLGVTHDPNNLDDSITEYNMNMEAYATANSGTDVDQINNPYSPIYGINFRYNFNYLLFRIGGTYTKNLFISSDGSIKTASGRNEIRIESYQASFPGSIGLIVPLKKRALAYMGGGMNLHFSYVSIEQTRPGGGFVTPDDTLNRYSGLFGGFHIIVGIEFPLSNRYTITGEWIHQMGSSPMIKSKDTSSETSIKINSNIILFGINFYIPI